ncbi:MAG: hypothetical protein ASARMPREDX12_003051 [Alectoria sarmentosa]|nr:MAG: hypothetical protein ASARMPREDX12_003051 [Alectoria sarmentosa]
MPSPRLPASISADLNEVLHNSGAPSLTTTSERLLFEHNAPHNDAEIAAWDAFINERYPETGPTSATAVGPGPQSSVDAREPTDTVTTAVMERPLEGRLASGPTGQETESRCSVPKVPKGLFALSETKAEVRRQRQIELARKRADENADPFVLEQPGPVESAQAENYYIKAPGRPLLPRPGAPGATLEGLATGPTGHLQYPEQHGLAFERLQTRSGGLSQHRQEPGLAFGGFTAGPNGGFQHPTEPALMFGGTDRWSNRPLQPHEEPGYTFGGLGSRPNGDLQHPQQPDWTVGGLDARPAGIWQYTQQSNLTFGLYPRGLNRPSPFLEEPGYTFGGSVARPSGISQYTRDPSMAYGGPTTWSDNLFPHQNEPGMAFMFNYPP